MPTAEQTKHAVPAPSFVFKIQITLSKIKKGIDILAVIEFKLRQNHSARDTKNE
jgi:hypothetical protein